MDKEKILEGMGYVDPALVEAADTPVRPVRRRWTRPALIAACLCVVLAGTAIAAVAGMEVQLCSNMQLHFEGVNDIPAAGVEAWITETMSAESFSPEVRELAKNADPESGIFSVYYDTVEEAESFLGVDMVPANSVLDNAKICGSVVLDNGQEILCRVEVFYHPDGALTGAFLTANYSVDNRVGVRLCARTQTEYSTGAGMAFAFGGTEEDDLTRTEYTTPSGLEAVIVTASGYDTHIAFFTRGAVLYQIDTCGDVGLETIYRILDAFQ